MSTSTMAHKPLKVDTTKLITVAKYAKEKQVTRQTAYNWVTEGKVKSVQIDGVVFIRLD